MRIVQIVAGISYGDAVSNHVLELDKILNHAGFDTAIYSSYLSARVNNKNCKKIKDYTEEKNDLIIYHLYIGCSLNREIVKYKAPVILYFHNITPSTFFSEDCKNVFKATEQGYRDLHFLAKEGKNLIGAISASSYSMDTLKKIGFHCPLYSIPILIDYEKYYAVADDKNILKLKADGYTNIIFVGRLSPHKKQQDVILSFYYYQKYYNRKSRLFLIGHDHGLEEYGLKLKKYINLLGLKNVYLTGQISYSSMISYYKIADQFLCESEHEGFCVPLIEAMLFDVPIIAYDCTAVGDTVGDGGILFQQKDPRFVASLMNLVCTDEALRNRIHEAQEKRLEYFNEKRVAKQYIDLISESFTN